MVTRLRACTQPVSDRGIFRQFPATLKQQYNEDRNKAVEALRAQCNSWVEKGQTVIRYMNAKVHASGKGRHLG